MEFLIPPGAGILDELTWVGHEKRIMGVNNASLFAPGQTITVAVRRGDDFVRRGTFTIAEPEDNAQALEDLKNRVVRSATPIPAGTQAGDFIIVEQQEQ